MIVRRILLAAIAISCTNLALFAQEQTPAQWPPHPKVAEAINSIEATIDEGPFAPNWDSLADFKVPQWYKDAKFGIFIHWGVYSVPAFGSEWYPRQMYIDVERRGDNFYQHHLETYGKHSEFGYKDFIPEFKAEKFDAATWIQIFKDAGARYIVPVAEHHDGFPMYDCSFTDWDSTQMGPKRDIIAELADAARSQGMKVGLSSHRAFNWKYYVRRPEYDNVNPEFIGLYGRPMPFLFKQDAADYQSRFEPQDEQFKRDWLARTCEIVDKYNPDLVWFDFGITATQETSYENNHFSPYLQKFAAYYYNKKRQADGSQGIINYKWKAFPESAAVLDLERSKMDAIREPFWQTDTAISSSSWGFTRDQKYKTAGRLVDDLVDIVSKNGCLLLNVGPRSDGTIPEADQEILREIGQWLRVNGEAIYDSKHWRVFGEGPTGTATGHLAEKKDKPYTAEDIRFTTKGDVLYAILLDLPEDGQVVIRSLAKGNTYRRSKIESITLLGSPDKVTFEQRTDGLHVALPKKIPGKFAFTLKIE